MGVMALIALLFAAAPIAPAHVWASHYDGGRCRLLRDAGRAHLWIIYSESDRVVEGDSAAPRGGVVPNGASNLAGMEMQADPSGTTCWRLAWRAEPWGPHPTDAADFGGRWPSGFVDIFPEGDENEWSGAIQISLPDDHRRETPETFRMVLLDPVTRRPLAGRVNRSDPRTGMRDHHAPAAALDMRNRLVFSVEDPPAASSMPRRPVR